MALPIGVPGGGVWGQVQVGGGGWVPLENEGKGGGGWGPAKEPESQCASFVETAL